MGNKAVLPAGKDTIGVEFVEGDAIANIFRMTTSAASDVNSWNLFTYDGSSKAATRGASLQLFGANHATQAGQVDLQAQSTMSLGSTGAFDLSAASLDFNSTGAITLDGTSISLTGTGAFDFDGSNIGLASSTLTFKGATNASILLNTSDGVDQGSLSLTAGGALPAGVSFDFSRGGFVRMWGNESGAGAGGQVQIGANNGVDVRSNSGNINLQTVAGGGVYLTSSINAIYSTSIYNQTTASAANMVVFSSGLMARSTSAAKYKKDIEPLSESALAANLGLEGVFYRSSCDADCHDRVHVGVIADQAEALSPWLVNYSADTQEIEGFQYERQTVFNLEHIKRLVARIEEQDERINELEEILYGPADLETV